MPATKPAPAVNIFDDEDDEGWQDMPVVREDTIRGGLDEEDQKKYHYMPSASKGTGATNATGNLIDFDDRGNEWRSKAETNENDYTRLRVNEEDESDEVHMRTKYLFDEDKAMTPLSQMQTTKDLLTEAQRIAYVGLCALTIREMSQKLKSPNRKELKSAAGSLDLWAMKIMGRLYYHMGLETQEQKMIESLGEHGVEAMDLVPALMTTHTVSNPEYDPIEARRREEENREAEAAKAEEDSESISDQTIVGDTLDISSKPGKGTSQLPPVPATPTTKVFQTTARVLEDTSTSTIPGVSTSLSAADEKVTLDIRWTVLCDLFLVLVADSVYDARSRVLLEAVAVKLGLGWLDLVRFESRVTEALEIQEGTQNMESKDIIEERMKSARKKRYIMMGLATVGGGLVIGLSAGLAAAPIAAGLGAAFGTVGATGVSTFLAGAGGAAVITTGGVLTGSGIAAKGMARRTRFVRTFDVLPLHNSKRVSAILTVPGFLNGTLDDPRLPFSVLDPVVGDVYSVLWEPEMIRETGAALKILTGEVLTQIGQTVLQATAMAAFMTALQWPIILTKLGYLIDNPWNNALDRAKAAGSVLADILVHRNLGVRPITLIGFSLGARVIFYALVELAKQKAYGIVQDVFLMGATLSVSQKTWIETRSVVSGRYVNGFAKNDWVLNYLFRATSGGVGTVAGLRPVMGVPGLENVDVTDKIAGHMSYRSFMPLILDELGFPVFADYFDEPEEPDFEGERVVIHEGREAEKKSWFSRKKAPTFPKHVSRPPSASSFSFTKKRPSNGGGLEKVGEDDDLPPRVDSPAESIPSGTQTPDESSIPKHAGFNLAAMQKMIGESEANPDELKMPQPAPPPINRTEPALLPLPVSPKRAASPFENTENPASSSRHDLSTTLARSMSLNEASSSMSRNDFADHDNSESPERTATPPLPAEKPSYSTSFSPPNSFSPPPRSTLSSPSVTSFQSPPSVPSYQPPTGLSFGGNDGSIWSDPGPRPSIVADSLSGPFGATSSSLTHTSFSSSRPTMPTDTGLSFGSTDGSITTSSHSFGASATTNDPWKIPTDLGAGKKKTNNTFYSNPWS
ncbi:duf726 domain protein [Moniliophthora roreri MCA 2997]|uniref:Duf726 domain protein n=1 Tax=Moniliophthora roreri (strain MCA 2997) TaxID=1381753 RepID=V2YL19_MONRO|nr:duf726 domain protein [Moniliophthora roreri MCA 2997]